MTSVINVSDLDGSNGFILNGIDAYDFSGASVSSVGDVNGDGFDDIIIGASGGDPNDNSGAGESYVVFGKAGGFAASFDLSSLNGSNGFTINGINENDASGYAFSSAGDVNGDGFDDIILGARRASPNGTSSAGQSYVVFGASGGFAASFDLSSLDGSNGFILNGIDERDDSGYSVSSAGDVNGDGFSDIIIGTRGADPNGNSYAGESYVVFGASGGFAASLELSSLDGSNGFVLNGIDISDNSGRSVSSAGDLNGDGFSDIIIGASGGDPNDNYDAGESYVVFGQSEGFGSSFDLSTLDGSNGFTINGIDRFDNSGRSVSSAGDVNGDGFSDIIIGAPGGDPNDNNAAGESYVVFGKAGGFGSSFDLSSLDGSNGFTINGIDRFDNSGRSVSSAGDVNGDGFSDIIIEVISADPNGDSYTGESYVVFGASGGFAASLDLSSLDGSNGFTIDGIDTGETSGDFVSSAGDINGDGFDDIIIGAAYANSYIGESFVVFGAESFATSGDDDPTNPDDDTVGGGNGDDDTVGGGNGDDDLTMTSVINLSDLNGSNGFLLKGIDTYDRLGSSVSSAGDINGDGFDDIIIGAPGGDPNGNPVGESYVVFGASGGFAASFDLLSLDGSNGFTVNGINSSGFSLSSAGDVNGDGFDDIIIVGGRDPNDNNAAAESYVVFGASGGFSSSLELSSLDGSNGFTINGIDAFDFLGSVSSAGDVNGDGFSDIIIGASGGDPNDNNAAGESYVVFGASGGFAPSLDLSSLDGSNGFVLNGIDARDNSGGSVSGAGDVNGDGFSDIIIGAAYADNDGNRNTGESYVVFGTSGGFSSSLDLSTLDGSNGFILNGIDADDFSGSSVSSAGDVNGDGFDDIVIGARGADPNGNLGDGESYVVFGTSGGFAASLDLSSLDGSNGFTINGIDARNDSYGSVSGAGDVNGDGFDDIIIGANGPDPNDDQRPGESYVVFGKSGGFSSSLELSSLDGSNGFVLDGINTYAISGNSVSSAGDVNGDGFDDIIIGSPTLNNRTGEGYIVFGAEFFGSSGDDELSLNANNNTVNALAGDDTIRARNGDDDIFGNDGNDKLFGQNGADTLDGGADDDTLIGGSGDDLLLGGTRNDRLNGGFGNDTLIGVDESSASPGLGERDVLRGKNGADFFVLGNATTVFYDDDGIAVADGKVSRAVIRDLDVGVDQIQLHGSATDYMLRETASGNTNIFYQPDGEVRDLIGIVRNTTGLDLSESSTFTFV